VQKQNHVVVSKEFVNRTNADENLLKNIVTGDETWFYGCMSKQKFSVRNRSQKVTQT
jgi:hypothetical protein